MNLPFGMSGTLQTTLQALIARVNRVFGAQHNPATGAHTTVTATAITIPDPANVQPVATVPAGMVSPTLWPKLRINVAPVGGTVIDNLGDVIKLGPFLFGGVSYYTYLRAAGAPSQIAGGLVVIGDLAVPSGAVNAASGAFTSNVTIGGSLSVTGAFSLVPSNAVSVAFSAGNFTSNVGSWTVAAGDQSVFVWSRIGGVAFWSIRILTSTVSGTPNNLDVTLPFTTAAASQGSFHFLDNLVSGTGLWLLPAASSTLSFYKDANAVAWANSTDQTYIYASGHAYL